MRRSLRDRASGTGSAIKPLDFGRRAEMRNLRKPASWGAIPIPSKPGPARIVRCSQGRAQLGGLALTQAGVRPAARLSASAGPCHDLVGPGRDTPLQACDRGWRGRIGERGADLGFEGKRASGKLLERWFRGHGESRNHPRCSAGKSVRAIPCRPHSQGPALAMALDFTTGQAIDDVAAPSGQDDLSCAALGWFDAGTRVPFAALQHRLPVDWRQDYLLEQPRKALRPRAVDQPFGEGREQFAAIAK